MTIEVMKWETVRLKMSHFSLFHNLECNGLVDDEYVLIDGELWEDLVVVH